ncbi:MAG: zf-TFIIB domain-containing protein [Halioglobus sp.]
MDCPKCSEPMEIVEFGTDVRVMRCTGCYGLFCKRATLQQLRDEWLSDTVLDKGSAALGAKHNEMRDISCPDCGNRMDRIKDHEQSHITLDSCSRCDGVFLDAGELTDMKSVTLMDHVRRLLTRLGK